MSLFLLPSSPPLSLPPSSSLLPPPSPLCHSLDSVNFLTHTEKAGSASSKLIANAIHLPTNHHSVITESSDEDNGVNDDVEMKGSGEG